MRCHIRSLFCGLSNGGMLLAFAVLFLFGCGRAAPLGAPSPEEATRAEVMASNPPPLNFQIIGMRFFDEQTIIFYHTTHNAPDGTQTLVMGYYVVVREQRGWFTRGGGGFSMGGNNFGLARYAQAYITNREFEGYPMVYGEIVSPSVASLEVLFQDGTIHREEVSRGVFAIFAPKPDLEGCVLRVFGEEETLLEEFDLGCPRI